MMVRLPYYGTNKCKPKELFPARNRTSQCVIINGTCMLMDVAIPGDKNVIKQESEKNLKYRDLIIEIQRMWNMKAKVIPVITGRLEPFQNH
jgi:hypothetical protein